VLDAGTDQERGRRVKKQAMVIGLGQFGMALAQSLAERSVEVMAVDARLERVQVASDFAASAIQFDATDEDALRRTSPDRRDVCVCAIGDENREGSIMCTALLRQLGAPHILARATDPVHERILRLVGAHDVVNPERAFGERLATRLLYSAVLDEVPIGGDLVLTELRPPAAFVGRTLSELSLPRRHEINVVAIRREGDKSVSTPSPEAPLQEKDILIVVAPPNAVARLLGRF
jgi:trk system potassium uptake protein